MEKDIPGKSFFVCLFVWMDGWLVLFCSVFFLMVDEAKKLGNISEKNKSENVEKLPSLSILMINYHQQVVTGKLKLSEEF